MIYREVEDQKQVVLVLIYLGALYSAENIIQVKGVKGVMLGQVPRLIGRGLLNVDPGQLAPGD